MALKSVVLKRSGIMDFLSAASFLGASILLTIMQCHYNMQNTAEDVNSCISLKEINHHLHFSVFYRANAAWIIVRNRYPPLCYTMAWSRQSVRFGSKHIEWEIRGNFNRLWALYRTNCTYFCRSNRNFSAYLQIRSWLNTASKPHPRISPV